MDGIAEIFITRIRRMGKVIVSVCQSTTGVGGRGGVTSVTGPRSLAGGGGCAPLPGSFPGLWSQILSGGDTPVPGFFS